MSTRLGIAFSIIAGLIGGFPLFIAWLLIWWRINDIVEENES